MTHFAIKKEICFQLIKTIKHLNFILIEIVKKIFSDKNNIFIHLNIFFIYGKFKKNIV